MTPERYMFDVAVLVVIGVAVMVLDIWLRRRKRTSPVVQQETITIPTYCPTCGRRIRWNYGVWVRRVMCDDCYAAELRKVEAMREWRRARIQ